MIVAKWPGFAWHRYIWRISDPPWSTSHGWFTRAVLPAWMSCIDKIVHHTPRWYPQLYPAVPQFPTPKFHTLHHPHLRRWHQFVSLASWRWPGHKNGKDVENDMIDGFSAFITTAFSSTGSKMGSWAKVEKHTYQPMNLVASCQYLELIHQKYCLWLISTSKNSGHCHLIFDILDDQAPSVIHAHTHTYIYIYNI